jgi:hypothetical protein
MNRLEERSLDRGEVRVLKNYICTVRSRSYKRRTVGGLVNDQIKS